MQSKLQSVLNSISPHQDVPFFRYPYVFAEHREEYMAAMMRVLESGAFILQEDVRLFEEELAAF